MKRLLLTLAVLLAAASSAHADTKIERARAHFKAAEAYFDSEQWDHAADEYKAAYALAPRPLLLFNIGSAFRRKAETTHAADDLRAALSYYRKYLEAEPKGKGAKDAQEFVATLDRDLAAAEKAPSPAPEAPPPVAATPPPIAATPPPAPVETSPPVEDSKRTLRIAGLVTAGIGVALVGTGVYFGLQAKSKNDELGGLKPGDMWDQAKYDAANDDHRNFILFTAVGAAAVAGGAIMTFVLGRAPEVAPAVTASTVGIAGRF